MKFSVHVPYQGQSAQDGPWLIVDRSRSSAERLAGHREEGCWNEAGYRPQRSPLSLVDTDLETKRKLVT